jgi:hypothetical protein
MYRDDPYAYIFLRIAGHYHRRVVPTAPTCVLIFFSLRYEQFEHNCYAPPTKNVELIDLRTDDRKKMTSKRYLLTLRVFFVLAALSAIELSTIETNADDTAAKPTNKWYVPESSKPKLVGPNPQPNTNFRIHQQSPSSVEPPAESKPQMPSQEPNRSQSPN